jgi:hypothetical protein
MVFLFAFIMKQPRKDGDGRRMRGEQDKAKGLMRRSTPNFLNRTEAFYRLLYQKQAIKNKR